MTQDTQVNVTGALLVSLNFSEFGNSKRDEEASADIVLRNGLEDKSVARVWKTLLPKGSALSEVNAAMRFLRSFHYRNTHAYIHDGPRMLPTKNFSKYQEGIRGGQDALDKAVLRLVEEYEDLKLLSRKKLGMLFKEADYPTADELRCAYRVTPKYSAMPVTDTLLDLGLEPSDAAEIRGELERDLQKTFVEANRKMWGDLHDRLATMVSQLTSDKASQVHDKTLEGLRSLVEVLPRLNLTNDSALDAMANRLSGMLQVEGSQLRRDENLRTKVATEARAVFGVMSAFMNAKRPQQKLEMKVAA